MTIRATSDQRSGAERRVPTRMLDTGEIEGVEYIPSDPGAPIQLRFSFQVYYDGQRQSWYMREGRVYFLAETQSGVDFVGYRDIPEQAISETANEVEVQLQFLDRSGRNVGSQTIRVAHKVAGVWHQDILGDQVIVFPKSKIGYYCEDGNEREAYLFVEDV